MTEPEDTGPQTLVRAAEIGKQAGLRFVYAGNLPGRVGDWENTRCSNCHEILIQRHGYHILQYHISPEGTCASCRASVPGRWASQFQGQITDHPYLPRLRRHGNPLIALT